MLWSNLPRLRSTQTGHLCLRRRYIGPWRRLRLTWVLPREAELSLGSSEFSGSANLGCLVQYIIGTNSGDHAALQVDGCWPWSRDVFWLWHEIHDAHVVLLFRPAPQFKLHWSAFHIRFASRCSQCRADTWRPMRQARRATQTGANEWLLASAQLPQYGLSSRMRSRHCCKALMSMSS